MRDIFICSAQALLARLLAPGGLDLERASGRQHSRALETLTALHAAPTPALRACALRVIESDSLMPGDQELRSTPCAVDLLEALAFCFTSPAPRGSENIETQEAGDAVHAGAVELPTPVVQCVRRAAGSMAQGLRFKSVHYLTAQYAARGLTGASAIASHHPDSLCWLLRRGQPPARRDSL